MSSILHECKSSYCNGSCKRWSWFLRFSRWGSKESDPTNGSREDEAADATLPVINPTDATEATESSTEGTNGVEEEQKDTYNVEEEEILRIYNS